MRPKKKHIILDFNTSFIISRSSGYSSFFKNPSFESNISYIELLEQSFIKNQNANMVRKLIPRKGELISGSFIFRTHDVGVYKKIIFPEGIITEIHKNDLTAWHWSKKDDLIASILILPTGLNAWRPLFSQRNK